MGDLSIEQRIDRLESDNEGLHNVSVIHSQQVLELSKAVNAWLKYADLSHKEIIRLTVKVSDLESELQSIKAENRRTLEPL